jgi:hypothetical protein
MNELASGGCIIKIKNTKINYFNYFSFLCALCVFAVKTHYIVKSLPR